LLRNQKYPAKLKLLRNLPERKVVNDELQSEYSLYQKDLVREATKFLREVEKVTKKEKSGKVVIVAVVKD
jgi:hypothetical protein